MAFSDSTRTALTTSEATGPTTDSTAGLVMPQTGWWAKVHWGLLLVASVLLVLAGRGQHFFYDEWAFLGGQLDALPLPDRYLLPHNEHWTLLPLLAYRGLAATVGLGSYWPYLTLLLLIHLGVTHILWRLMLVTGSRPLVATALAAVFSVLGSAAEDLVWAFQITFLGSTLLGLSAVYLAVTGPAASARASWRKTGILAGLTLASLACSGVGLAYLIVVPWIYLRRRRRQAIVVLFLPLLVYAAWYAGYGHSLSHAPVASATFPLKVGAFLLAGLTAALTNYAGFHTNLFSFLAVGVPLLAWLTLACRDWRAERTLTGRTHLATYLGAILFLGTAGVARAGLGTGFAMSPRYTYVAVALLLPGFGQLISRGVDRHPRLSQAVVPLALAIAASNALQLFTFAADTRHDNDASRRVLVAATDLLRSNAPLFVNQLPEPTLAPDLTTGDLRSGHLDPAFEGVSPQQPDRLTASLNLQIRVARVQDTGGTEVASACRTEHLPHAADVQRITVEASRESAPGFLMRADAWVVLTLRDGGSRSAERLVNLPKGAYVVSSAGRGGELTIESMLPTPTLASC